VRAERILVLADHYWEGDPCYGRFVNTEILFSHEGHAVTLHQGQSAMAGDYEIKLDIARTIDRYFCPDRVSGTSVLQVSKSTVAWRSTVPFR
jgi:hypothetical protein